ncbi:hypothetical protein GCM10010912_01170 [Paenibacillus albidus]|uniref:Uncharacterized protein n=1 Tax=Paenibacillus albidus TaxID=2041023 RepID=A0A917BWU1_9BACL|nr:hypothetical protein [Paenibacillus albidus]MBT2290299.1 hypothetical protein [Paenibacillus albidus]GGF59713.1 hypothetical protein GCM10010912_01170 [Paenibacillus albidus]
MLAGLKELKNWVTGIGQPWTASGDEDYRRIEYTVERHLHTPQARNPLTYVEEARIKTIKYH